jgi:hypothetical protein
MDNLEDNKVLHQQLQQLQQETDALKAQRTGQDDFSEENKHINKQIFERNQKYISMVMNNLKQKRDDENKRISEYRERLGLTPNVSSQNTTGSIGGKSRRHRHHHRRSSKKHKKAHKSRRANRRHSRKH